MDTDDGVALMVFFLGLILGGIIGSMICAEVDTAKTHNIAIAHEIGHYNSTNGIFQWNWETNK